MANIRKQFNFRNGVQVDDDNLVVSPTGLVGIGTTVPTEVLDVRGTAKVVGLITASQIYTPLLNAANLSITSLTLGDSIIGGGVSIRSGIITAAGSGVVTYYGDGGSLLNLPTSQWLDIDAGLGFTSIYAIGNVGVATNDPRYSLQIGGFNNIAAFVDGVGIDSIGNIVATGIITAGKFVGVGSDLTGISAPNIAYGTISNDRIPTLLNSKLPSNIIVSGVITATSGFSGNLTGDVTGNVIGIATFARFLTGDPDITVTDVIADDIDSTTLTTQRLTVTGSSSQQTINASKIEVGTSGTYFSVVTDGEGRIGIGSTTPTQALQIIKNGDVAIEIVGTESSLILAEELSGITLSSGAGSLRYGNSDKTFDLINYGSGNFNNYLHFGASGIDTGRFAWVYGQTLNELMALTYEGNLGIGVTNPTNTLQVVGTSTVTGDAWVGGNLSISGTLNVSSIQLPELISNSNIYTLTGVSTFNDTVTQGVAQFSSIGIGSTSPIANIDAQQSLALFSQIGLGSTAPRGTLDVTGQSLFEGVGIGTTNTGGDGLVVSDDAVVLYNNAVETYGTTIILDSESSVGIGSTVPRCAVDFSEAGLNILGGAYRYMLPPRITTAERVGLATIAGAFIFNTDTSKFQGYTGVAWTDFH
jgi:hypothetical protein